MVAAPELPNPPRVMTPEEFLEWEAEQEGRYEYADGRIIEMAGEAPEHNQISGKIYRRIGNALEDTSCVVYIAEVRFRVSGTRYRYPDVTALCGTPQFADTRPRTLLNPQVVIEVLSRSTRDIDLIDKLAEYLALDSVTDYLIFEQTQMRAVHYRPTGPKSYSTQIYTEADDAISLDSLGVTLTLGDIYRRVTLSAPEVEAEETNETESEPNDAAL